LPPYFAGKIEPIVDQQFSPVQFAGIVLATQALLMLAPTTSPVLLVDPPP
jgi:hypothetical protein